MIMPWIVFKLSKQFQSVLAIHYVKIHAYIYSLYMYIGFKDETNVLFYQHYLDNVSKFFC